MKEGEGYPCRLCEEYYRLTSIICVWNALDLSADGSSGMMINIRDG